MLPTGVDRVGLAYIRRYGSHARAVLSERGFSATLTERDSQYAFEMLLSSNGNRRAIRGIVIRALINRQLGFCNDRAFLLHTSHNGMEYARYYNVMRKNNALPVFMIHDLIPLTHPEYCRPGVDAAHRQRVHTALRHAAGIIANSEITLASIKKEAHDAGLRLPASTVARLAPGVRPDTAMLRPIDGPYFVMLGTIEPRKNHWFILHVWRQLIERVGAAAPKLVIIGRRGWECENVVDMLERCTSIQPCIVEEPECSDERLQSWLQHAQALLFPSFAEGYGMPLVEALAQHVPVLASHLDVFREIAGDIPDYLDPLDGPGWLAHILSYAHPDSPARAAQLTRLQCFREPTWAEHFEHVDRFLETLN
ncbi:hypothetical protein BJL96_10610 [Burkholderia cenocepacia]|jgi:glycosyltransferase involved in cell wall biosynthesis|nr:glycosyltransferase family 1 protein [Burkholderia cenocepacia]AMU15801.1 hypothetical protein A3203_23170 [Burkholderia cenocepacia]NGO94091.1 hypothetical protein [Burkholderia cenocepacia]